ncbi:MAG: hypothetical protein K2Y23_09375 [Cyanobacteria bacterium]|nr:hypothetical protein [Cyanobacteriota bacterium]
MTPAAEEKPRQASRWETFVWPRWLPVRARMPLVAQVTGAVALTALIVGPWWASAPDAIPATTEMPATAETPAAVPPPAPAPAAAVPAGTVPAPAAVEPPKPKPVVPARPAHLNLDVRHSFRNVDFTVTVDNKPVLQTKLEGSGKRFGVFGKRGERGYTKTLDLTPGVHLVRIRVLSANDKFDQTRVERFDLGSSSVASMRISADKTGLTLLAERPPVPAPDATPAPEPIAAAPVVAAPVPAAAPVQAAAVPQASNAASRQDVNAVADLLQSVRSMLIAIAGFVASAATGFVVQEYLRSRRSLIFAPGGAREPAEERRKRRRPGKPAPRYEDDGEDDDGDYLPEADQADQKVTT